VTKTHNLIAAPIHISDVLLVAPVPDVSFGMPREMLID